ESPDSFLRRQGDGGVTLARAHLRARHVRLDLDLPHLPVHRRVLRLIADHVVGAGVADDAPEGQRHVVDVAHHEAAGHGGEDVRPVLAGVERGRPRPLALDRVGIDGEAVDVAAAVDGVDGDAAARRLRRHRLDRRARVLDVEPFRHEDDRLAPRDLGEPPGDAVQVLQRTRGEHPRLAYVEPRLLLDQVLDVAEAAFALAGLRILLAGLHAERVGHFTRAVGDARRADFAVDAR